MRHAPVLDQSWLVPRLADFADAHPDIELLTVANEALASFRSDGIDLAIRQGRPPFAGGLRVELLAPLELCAVCSPRLAEEIAPLVQLDDFATLPLIQDSHDLWTTLLEDAGVAVQRRFLQFNQTALAMDAAANGQGVALAPRLLVSIDIRQGRLVEVWRDARPDQGGYYLIHPRHGVSDAGRDGFIDWALAQVRGQDT